MLDSLDIPEFYWNTFKNHEEEVGPIIEKLARESCMKAAALERELTIKNYEQLRTML